MVDSLRPWYEYPEDERIQNVYSKYTIQEFWDWWSNKQKAVMEVRIKDFNLIKEIAKNFHLAKSFSGVYAFSSDELKQVIMYIRNKAVVWFGINPRHKVKFPIRKKDGEVLVFDGFTGKDVGIECISHFLIDIDRRVKDGPASREELNKADILANAILDVMRAHGWANAYCKICSGNGVQLLFRLDYPIKIPILELHPKLHAIMETSEFIGLKRLVKEGIGKEIIRATRKLANELDMELDGAVFNISRVASLPFTKNFKYGSFTWRGIVEMKDGVNEGLSEYIYSKMKKYKITDASNIFKPMPIYFQDRITISGFWDNPIVKLMLEHDFPAGQINNTIWFQLKILLRDYKVDMQSDEFLKFHEAIKLKHNRSFSLNLPDKKFPFDKDVVNAYCYKHMLPLCYPLWEGRTERTPKCFELVDFKNACEYEKEQIVLPDDTTILQDLRACKEKIPFNDVRNQDVFYPFINACVRKYGLQHTQYLYDNGVFLKYFEYDFAGIEKFIKKRDY